LKHIHILGLALITIATAMALCTTCSVKLARAEDYTLRIYPSPQYPTLTSSLSFTVNISIKWAYQITSYQVYVSWDPTLLSVASTTKGKFLSNNTQILTSTYKNINNNNGLLTYVETQSRPTLDTAVSGNGTLFTVNFTAKRTGQCTIDLHNTLVYFLTVSLTHVVEDGYFDNQQVTYSYGGIDYNSTINTNSTVYNSSFNLDDKTLSFNVSGQTGTTGYVNVSIPKGLLDVDAGEPPGTWVVMIDGVPTTSFIVTSNSTHTFIYFSYTHSDHSIAITGNKVIPELSPSPYLLALMLATLAALSLLLRSKKHQKLT